MKAIDAYGRTADYLRIAVTDRCNLRCQYCMPAEGIDFADRKDLLSYEEITRAARLFHRVGVRKIRITGGEPFVRKDIDYLLRSLSKIVDSVHITTNATLLHQHIPLLQEIGIGSLNISLDSLDAQRNLMITRRDAFDQVIQNIKESVLAGLKVKINMVVMQGINDMEILDFLAFGASQGVEIRYIEAMPFNAGDGNRKAFLSAKEILHQVAEAYPDVQLIKSDQASSALRYDLGKGQTFGIIPAFTRSLCASCNRIRLTPQGEVLTCLYAKSGLDFRELLRSDKSDEDLVNHLVNCIKNKRKDGREEEEQAVSTAYRSMTTIGG